MKDYKLISLAVALVIYFLYSMHVWYNHTVEQKNVTEIFMKDEAQVETDAVTIQDEQKDVMIQEEKTVITKKEENVKRKKIIPLHIKNACSVIEIFTIKPITCKSNKKEEDTSANTITTLSMLIFLLILLINAVLDALKAHEEERLRLQNPDLERRQSLAEFANKRTLRRESSKFGLQLFQILESCQSNGNDEEEKNSRRQSRPYTRGESTNSYLSEKNYQGDVSKTPDTPTGEKKLVKRQSVAKVYGSPAMVRRSSFPALPINPDVQALMLGHRRPSTTDSDDEDGRGRRVRIIRRF